ncbi:DNA primase [Wohlfahrtiimonas chitiniclastica]|uniref:DNA primase n=1 Tax=Wohlfahrtiimonas chitiniclastica TaxID=400946 RepID=UPI001BD12A8E|nr:DNA primase [Wohlfahrtiimonas chitiniclastica]MBS7816216.1 DNA primase [Wohlfahrtiimonas chitiniclastica]MBS7821789.1 DNA primase [Wohlfahrtiimonas chitiniclastica]MBS7829581.1 DNA primase [Wohlfahrtiimonas chitiniclastica]MBS7831548.1 DNA primase [Wohlfahrtiimonas chitiniclastica]
MSKGYIPNQFVDEVIGRVDIVEIINQRVPLKKMGNSFKACCPFHQEKSPSFMVNQSKQLYHCFGCGAKGNVVTFLMEYEKLEFIESIEYLAHHEGMVVPYERRSNVSPEAEKRTQTTLTALEEANQFFQRELAKPNHQHARDYLANRDLNSEDIARFNIGFAPDSWNALLMTLKSKGASEKTLEEAGLIIPAQNKVNHFYDRFRDRVMFPIRNRKGQTIAFGGRIIGAGEPKYLNSPETSVFHKGKELYGLYELRRDVRNYNEILVVEGYMDVVMMSHFGIQNVVATLGTAMSNTQVANLFRYTHSIVFCFDGDEAGQKAAYKAMENALPVMNVDKEIKFLFLPDRHDPDSYLKAHGQAAFLDLVNHALPLSEYLFAHFEQRYSLESIEGRSQLLTDMGALINSMPDIPLRDLLRVELGKKANVSASILEKHVSAGVVATPVRRKMAQPQGQNLVERGIVLLLNNLNLAKTIHNYEFLLDSEEKGAKVLYQLITTIIDYPEIKTAAQLLGRFQHQPWIQYVESLSVLDHMLDPQLHQSEYTDAMRRLAKRVDPRKQVLAKFAQGLPLSDEELKLLKLN